MKQFSDEIEVIHGYVSPGRVLDIGCAFGFFLDVASENGWETYGVEISEYAARHIGDRHNVSIGELSEAKFPDNSFDLITLWDVIEHVANPPELLAESHRILKEDGLLFVNLPNKDDLFLKVKSTLYRLMGGRAIRLRGHFTHHIYYFSPRTIERLLSQCGFRIVKMELRVEDLIINGEESISMSAKGALKRLCHIVMTMWKSKRNEIVVFAKPD